MNSTVKINNKERKIWEIILIALCTVYFGAVLYSVGYSVAVFPLIILAFLALMGFSFKGKPRILKDIYLFIILFIDIVYFYQLITLIAIAEENGIVYLIILLHDNLGLMTLPAVLALYLAVRAFLNRRLTAFIVPVPFALLAVTDYYVTLFRGHEIVFPDLISFKTALNVAGNYSFNPVIPLALIVVPYILTVIIATCIDPDKSPVPLRIVFGVCSILSLVIAVKITDNYFKDHKLEQWEYNSAQYNTFFMNFNESIIKSIVFKPDNYDLDILNSEDSGITASSGDAPNIIVIMNESYTDISVYRDYTGDIEDPDPFWDSLTENTVHGYALSSVYGGNTANSEFEFLTGLSMFNIPEGAVVYNQYLNNDVPSLPRFLDSLGYTSTAMHPYRANGWRRNVVYPMLGFDGMYFEDDFTADDGGRIRDYISDRFAYEHMLDYTGGLNDPYFMFLITMQNHGGYDTDLNGSFVPHVYLDDPVHEDLNNFLSLIHESDMALEYLIDQLKESDDKYVVLIFGDHQPSVYFTNLHSDTEPGGSAWVIPYLIWTNYDIDPSLTRELDHTEDYTSINYLSLDLLTVAGITPDPYYDLLYRIRDEVPCINSAGYRLQGESGFHPRDELTDNRMMEVYSYLTYDVLFDRNDSTLTAVG